MTKMAKWRLVGEPGVREAPLPSDSTVQQLKELVQATVSISKEWLEVSRQGEELAASARLWTLESHDVDCRGTWEAAESGPRDNAASEGLKVRSSPRRKARLALSCPDSDVLHVSLVLPKFARLSSEAVMPRARRSRVTNQPAVRSLAWQPALLSHEEEQEEWRRDAFAVYVEHIPNFPAEYLRLDLECQSPTVGLVKQRFREVTGLETVLYSGCRKLDVSRQYLHRLEITPGAVIRCQAVDPTPVKQVSFDAADRTALNAPVRRLDAQMSQELEVENERDSGVQEIPESRSTNIVEGRNDGGKENFGQIASQTGKRPAIISATSGQLWSGSSRRRLLSSGVQGLRGPGGEGTLTSERISASQIDGTQHRSMPTEEASGGFIEID